MAAATVARLLYLLGASGGAEEPAQYAPWWDDLREPGVRVEPRAAAARACAPGCSAHGNCNLWTGECECPHGWHGRACERMVLPACRVGDSSADVRRMMAAMLVTGAAAAPYVGPLSCDCVRQAIALRHYLHISMFENMYWAEDSVGVVCAVRRDEAPLPGPASDASAGGRAALSVHEVLDAPDRVAWGVLPLSFRYGQSAAAIHGGLGSTFIRAGTAQPLDWLRASRAKAARRAAARQNRWRAPLAPAFREDELRRLVPRARCRDACADLGACAANASRPPACECFAGAARTPLGSCALAAPAASARARPPKRDDAGLKCPRPRGRECAGAGRCDGNGFCKCADGRWGLDCAHALDARGRPVVRVDGEAPARARDAGGWAGTLGGLPAWLGGRGGASPPEPPGGAPAARPRIYVYTLPPLLSGGPGFYADLYAEVTRRVLESAYRAACAEGADFYWLPGPFRLGQAVDKLAYTRARWPYWNASVARADGVARHVTYQGWELDPGKVFSGKEPARFPHAELGLGAHGARAEAEISVASPAREWLSLSHNGMADAARAPSGERTCVVCFQPGKDIVVPFRPGIIDVPLCSKLRERSVWSPGAPRRAGEGRETVFFFAGSTPPYSVRKAANRAGGLEPHVRADIHALHNATPGFVVIDSGAGRGVEPVEWMLKSQFCWVPPGQR